MGQTVLVWVTLLEPFLALLAVGFDLVQQVGLRFLAVDLVVPLRQLRLPLRIVLLLLGLVLVQVGRLAECQAGGAGNGALLGHLLRIAANRRIFLALLRRDLAARGDVTPRVGRDRAFDDEVVGSIIPGHLLVFGQWAGAKPAIFRMAFGELDAAVDGHPWSAAE